MGFQPQAIWVQGQCTKPLYQQVTQTNILLENKMNTYFNGTESVCNLFSTYKLICRSPFHPRLTFSGAVVFLSPPPVPPSLACPSLPFHATSLRSICFCFIILILSSCSQHRNTPQSVLSWKSLFHSHLPQPLLLSLPLPFISQSSFLQRSSICCLYFLSFHSFLKPILTRSRFS